MHKIRVAAWLAPLILLFFLATIAPSMILHTKSYPMTVVEGDSMLPRLHQGDIVIYQGLAQGQTIPNGTIIIYLTGRTGTPILDQTVKPAVIHRVVSVDVQRDGIYYQTKGDNNQSPDPSLVRSDKILGTQLAVVPTAGNIVLFLKSPQGLVAALAILLTTNQSVNSRRTLHSKVSSDASLSETGTNKDEDPVQDCTCESCLCNYP